jgi:hypothetical protein
MQDVSTTYQRAELVAVCGTFTLLDQCSHCLRIALVPTETLPNQRIYSPVFVGDTSKECSQMRQDGATVRLDRLSVMGLRFVNADWMGFRAVEATVLMTLAQGNLLCQREEIEALRQGSHIILLQSKQPRLKLAMLVGLQQIFAPRWMVSE